MAKPCLLRVVCDWHSPGKSAYSGDEVVVELENTFWRVRAMEQRVVFPMVLLSTENALMAGAQ